MSRLDARLVKVIAFVSGCSSSYIAFRRKIAEASCAGVRTLPQMWFPAAPV
jgi:hypothetical protein